MFCDYDYRGSLCLLRDARKKRGKVELTKKFFDTLKKVNRELPTFAVWSDLPLASTIAAKEDVYSNQVLREHAPGVAGGRRVAKLVSGNGNCLFNSASLSLIGRLCQQIYFLL